MRILDSIDLTQKYPDQLQLEFFDPRLIEEVIAKCERESEQGVSYYDIKALHRILMNEINNLQGTTMAGQRSLVMEVRCCHRMNFWGPFYNDVYVRVSTLAASTVGITLTC